MTRHQYGISALVSQTSFGGETSGSVTKCRLFSQAAPPASPKNMHELFLQFFLVFKSPRDQGATETEDKAHAKFLVACVAGVRKGMGRELGRETTRPPRVSLAPKTLFPKTPFPFPFKRLPRRLNF